MLEAVQQALQPLAGQPASGGLYRLPDLIDVFGGMGKVQDPDRIRSLVVHQSL